MSNHTTTLEIDLSRFTSGQSYVLDRTITNPKVDKRIKNGGRELGAHAEFPKGLRFVLDVIETRNRPLGKSEDGVDIYQIERKYIFAADGGHAFRYFKLEAHDVRGFVSQNGVEKQTKHFSYVLPHQDYSREHHKVALDAILSLVQEPVTLASLEARADGVYKTGWEVISELVASGRITVGHVSTVVEAMIAEQSDDRAARIRHHEAEKEGS